MSSEMYWLTWTLLITSLLCFPYVLNRFAVRGLYGLVKNPEPSDAPLAPWAQRAQRAHANAVENLVVFAPAVVGVELLHLGNPLTGAACAVYFWSRLVHYVAYSAGIPVVRTLGYFGGWFGTAVLLARELGWL